MKNLYVSLNNCTKKEILDDNNKLECSICNNKQKAMIKNSFHKLPRILLIFLKRFEINNNICYKNNDYLEFPLELDFHDYLNLENKEEQSNIDFLFKLKGFIIHNGNSQFGHYFCIMKENKTNNWLKFDNRVVTEFNFKYLNDEAFGGNINLNFEYLNEKNAYLLIHEKYNNMNCEIFNNISNDRIELNNNNDNMKEINSLINSYSDLSYENNEKYNSSINEEYEIPDF